MDSITSRILNSYLPMSEQSFLMLLCLLEPRHGYGIMQQVSEQTKGRLTLSPSTVYTILYKMETDGLIETVSEADRRKVYSITPLGKTVLTAEADRLNALCAYADSLISAHGKNAAETACAV